MKQPQWYEGRLWNGMGLGAWLRLLVRNRFRISPSRITSAMATTALSPINSGLGLVQRIRFGRQIRAAAIDAEPTFIIGHWRTGTTMLHELLALDPANRCPSTYESFAPHHFLVTERFLKKWLTFALPKVRPMDNMRLSFDRPQEDEVALCLLGSRSSFLTVAFPNCPLQDPEYVTLENLPPARLARWEHILRRFLQSLLVKRRGRLVLKSPQHTFRLKTLTRLFPNAKFIHITRNPQVVIPSTIHFWWSMYQTHGLQVPRKDGLEEFVLKTFAQMHEQYQSTRNLIAADRLIELNYEELVADPVNTVRRIYESFDWPDFDTAEPSLKQYAARSQRYQTNKFDPSPELMRQIAKWCHPYCELYGYQASEQATLNTVVPMNSDVLKKAT